MTNGWSHDENAIKNYINLEDCMARRIYKISSRNLEYGIYDGKNGFIGIRTKFGERYLFTEYHWDSPSFATVKPLKYIDIDLPDNIPLTSGLQSIDKETGRPVDFDRPVKDGGRGWYFIDTNEANQSIRAIHVQNKAMFDLLEKIEKDNAEVV